MVEWDGARPDPKGLGYIFVGGRPVSPVVDEGPSRVRTDIGSSSSLGEAQFRRLAWRIDAVDERQSRFTADLTGALSSAFGALGADVPWPTYGASSVYPPPDSPPAEGDDAGY